MGSKETDMTEQLHTHTYTSKLSSVIESSFGNENLKNIFKKLLRYTWVKWEPRAIQIPYIFLIYFCLVSAGMSSCYRRNGNW